MESCLICQCSFDKEKLTRRPYPKVGVEKGPTEIVDCPGCGVGRAMPFPTDEQLDNLIDWSEYWHIGHRPKIRPKNYPLAAGLGRKRLELVLNLYQGNLRDISILDIGAGQGFFGIEAAKKLGEKLSQYSIVEYDPALEQDVSEAWEHYNFSGQLSYYSELANTSGQYDFVVLSHVLEHVRDPRDFLNQSLSLLKPGGLMFIDVPHKDYRFKENVFLHLYFYTPNILKELVQSIGGVKVLQSDTWGRFYDQTSVGRFWSFVYRQYFRIAYQLKRVIPVQLTVKLYTHLYGGNTKNPNGTWVRLIAKKEF